MTNFIVEFDDEQNKAFVVQHFVNQVESLKSRNQKLVKENKLLKNQIDRLNTDPNISGKKDRLIWFRVRY